MLALSATGASVVAPKGSIGVAITPVPTFTAGSLPGADTRLAAGGARGVAVGRGISRAATGGAVLGPPRSTTYIFTDSTGRAIGRSISASQRGQLLLLRGPQKIEAPCPSYPDDRAVGREIGEHVLELQGRHLAPEDECTGRSAIRQPRDQRARGSGVACK